MKRTLLSLFLLAAVVGSCSKSQTELPSAEEDSADRLTIAKARSLFERQKSHTKSVGEGDNSIIPDTYQPLWDYALRGTNHLLESVEAPIETDQRYVAQDSDGNDHDVFQRILVADGVNFPEASGYVMTIIPTSGGYDISRFNHAEDKAGFSGIVLYHWLVTGQFVRVDRYADGVSVDNIWVSSYTDYQLDTLQKVVDKVMGGIKLFRREIARTKGMGDDVLHIDPVCVIGVRPGRGGSGGGLGGVPGSGSGSGRPQYEDMTKPTNPEGSGGGGWLPPKNDTVIYLFENMNLSDAQAAKVNQALDALKDMCGSKWLIDQVKALGLSIAVSNLSEDKGGSYTYGSGKIEIAASTFARNDGEELMYVLIHEMFHAYQDKVHYKWGQQGVQTFIIEHGLVNIEFEAYTFTNLLFGYIKGRNIPWIMQPPVSENSWMNEYLKDINIMTDTYTTQITSTQLDELYKTFHTNFSETFGQTDFSTPKLDALKDAISKAVNTGDCYNLK